MHVSGEKKIKKTFEKRSQSESVPIFKDIDSEKVLNHIYILTYIHKLLTLERYAVVEEVCSVCVCLCK